MPRRKHYMLRGSLQAVSALLMALVVVGCTYKPAYLQGEKTEIAYRWKVETIAPKALSEDQRDILERRGPPTYVRFYREVESRDPVYAWIYAGEGDAVDLVWFVDGKRAEAIAVDSNPSAFTSTTRRRTRLALLVGTGAAIVPAIVLLAND